MELSKNSLELDFPNEVIEKLLFRKLMTDKTYVNIMTGVFDKRWFSDELLGTTTKLALMWNQKYNKSPSVEALVQTVKKYVEKHSIDNVNVDSIQQTITTALQTDLNIPEEVLNKNLKEFIRKKGLFYAMLDNVEKLESKNSESVIDECLSKFDKINKIAFNDTDLGMSYFDKAQMEKHWEYINNPEAKIKTGWDTLDYYTNGGFLKKGRCLSLVMAGPGLGKSLWLSNLAVNYMKQNLSVVVISLEMSQDVYAMRFDAHISQDNINKLKETCESSKSKIEKFYEKYPNANLIIKEYPPKSIRSRDIDTYLENLKLAGKNFDVVIVDYLNLVLPNKSSDNMFQDGKSVSEELRGLSYKYEVPFVSAVQANTEGINSENIDMQNVSESRGIVHTTDFLMGMYSLDDDREHGIINARILKNRFGGQVGKLITYKLDPENLRFEDVSMNKNDYESQTDITASIIDNLDKSAEELNDLA